MYGALQQRFSCDDLPSEGMVFWGDVDEIVSAIERILADD